MSILAWIQDQRDLKLKPLNPPPLPKGVEKKGLWTRCENCGLIIYVKHLKQNNSVCFGCESHLQMTSQERIDYLTDPGSWRPLDEMVSPCDPLEFYDQKDYTERLKEAQERTHLQDAVQTGTAMLDGIPIALGVLDFDFMGGSMGSVVGEKITRLVEYATQEGLNLVLVSASGGARMQEGVLSLMQMAKISAALQIYQSSAKLLYISIITSPTTGGVTASFAMLGDLIFAEPKALIGFAGRRVIKQTLQEVLPDDFQTAEYLLHHGLLDLIVSRSFLRQALFEIMSFYKDAPCRRAGVVPYGLQQNLSSVREERLRRNLGLFEQPDLVASLQGKSSSREGEEVVGLRQGATQTDLRLPTETLDSIRFAQPVLYQPTRLLSTRPEKGSLVIQSCSAPTSLNRKGSGKDSIESRRSGEPKDSKKQGGPKSLLQGDLLSYREVLVSFCFVFNLFLSDQATRSLALSKQVGTNPPDVGLKPTLSYKALGVDPSKESDRRGFDPKTPLEKKTTPVSLFSPKETLSEVASQDNQHQHNHLQADLEDLVERSVLVARTQALEWKTFYVTQDQRMTGCASLDALTGSNNQKEGFGFVLPTTTKPGQDKTSNQEADPVGNTGESSLRQSNREEEEGRINPLTKGAVNPLFACLVFKNVPNVISWDD